MGWLSKIFKGSDHKFSDTGYNRRYDADVSGNHPSSSWDAVSDNTEDIDLAIALSLAEEEQKEKHVHVHDSETQLKEDEQLARALQESLTHESPPPQLQPQPQHQPQPQPQRGYRGSSANENGRGMGNLYQPMHYPYSIGFRICAGCNTEIGHGRFLNCMGAVWHPECFCCHACNQPISDYEFSMYGSFPYHKTCYKEHHHPKCDVCKHFIPTNANGLIEYRAHPFWSQKYCPYHELDGTPRCCSCERMEPRDTKYVALDDGRKLCLECLDSVIMDTGECQPLYIDIQEFYEGMDMKVEQQVPLLLVERQALNEAMDGERHGHHHMPETRGLCLSEEQTISTVIRRPRVGGGNRSMDMRREPYKLTRRCEVTAILILYGLPRLLTGSILAHEMMHAWLRLRGYRTLSQDIEEGICQVLAHLWLQTQLQHDNNFASTSSTRDQRKRSPYEQKLGEFFKHQIESDTSPIYGNGFRAANQAVLKYGLEKTLDHIRMTGTLPY